MVRLTAGRWNEDMTNNEPTTSPSESDDRPVLVTGATGKTGRRIVDRLTEQGVAVRAASRRAEIPFDWEDRSTWSAALQGARAAYIAYVPDLAVPGAADTVTSFAVAAREAGVERLVLLSGRGEPEAQAAEERVAAVLPTTRLRAAWFMQNFDESFMLDGILEGTLVLPVGDVREPFVDADDIADVAVAALVSGVPLERVFEVTGARSLTFAEVARELGSATGRQIEFVSVPWAEYAEAVRAAGEAEEFVQLLGYLFNEVLDGRNASPATGVSEALGREPRSLASYAERVAATGVWSVPVATAS